MLPCVKSTKSTAIAALLAISVAIPASPALAWGQREQDVLKGVLGTLAVTAVIKEINKNNNPKPNVIYAVPEHGRAPVYYQPAHPPTDIYSTSSAQAFNSYSYNERQAIQRQLARRGFYRGAIDGSFGQQTYRATLAYARATGDLRLLATRNGAFAVFDSLFA